MSVYEKNNRHPAHQRAGHRAKSFINGFLENLFSVYAIFTHTLLQHPAIGFCDDANDVNGQ